MDVLGPYFPKRQTYVEKHWFMVGIAEDFDPVSLEFVSGQKR